jgi:hypothetical protein
MIHDQNEKRSLVLDVRSRDTSNIVPNQEDKEESPRANEEVNTNAQSFLAIQSICYNADGEKRTR